MTKHNGGDRRLAVHERGRFNRRALVQAAATTSLAAGHLRPGSGLAQTPVSQELPLSGQKDPDSEFLATASVESSEYLDTDSDGDLWPCAWADDGWLYLLNGDGRGFDRLQPWADIVANRVSGTPETGLDGERLAAGDDLGPIWGDPDQYNRKPTGLIAVDGDGDGTDELYAAIQDLRHGENAFDDAPNASISVSRDYGRTWQSTETPMFHDHRFTTVFFLDFGQSNRAARVLGPDGDRYVYAYGIDHNWRDSFTDTVPDPTELHLARVPIESIQVRDTWEFFSGLDGTTPTWTADIDQRVPVLAETRRVYPTFRGNGIHNMTVISQGSVVYNEPLDRYIYTSWTEYTFEFFEAPRPWGPWKLFLQKDFGSYPWFGGGDDHCISPKNGGYATVVPSKFISDDGRTMWMQANWFVGVGCGDPNYNFSLRRLTVEPFAASQPDNSRDENLNLAIEGEGVTPIEKSVHFGHEDAYNDGASDRWEQSLDGENKHVDFWGYTWRRAYTVNELVYTTGEVANDGGWFEASPRVQVRQNLEWLDVDDLVVSPHYPSSEGTESFASFTFRFSETWGDGIRIIGEPGGRNRYTSISELEVYFR